jgi:hypothetical protein
MGEGVGKRSESIELFMEDQAFSPSCDLAPPTPPPYSPERRQTEKEKQFQFTPGGGGEEVGQNHFILRRESLVLFTSFNTLYKRGWEMGGGVRSAIFLSERIVWSLVHDLH